MLFSFLLGNIVKVLHFVKGPSAPIRLRRINGASGSLSPSAKVERVMGLAYYARPYGVNANFS
jgi:hypothetical protein